MSQTRREGVRLIRSLAKFLLLSAVAIPAMALMPLAAIAMTRTSEGTQLFFWCAPWSAAFWTLVYSQLSASEFWLGAEHVRRWREAHGGLLRTSLWATAWMFFGLIFSYSAEFALIFLDRSPGSGRALLPLVAYSPVFVCWCWRRIHG